MTDTPEPLVYLREIAPRVHGPYTRAHAERVMSERPGEFEIVETTAPGGSRE